MPLHLSSLTDTFDCLLQCCVCIYIKVDTKERGISMMSRCTFDVSFSIANFNDNFYYDTRCVLTYVTTKLTVELIV